MSTNEERLQDRWRQFYGPNLGYIQEQYERYARDPEAVSPHYRELFSRLGAPVLPEAETGVGQPAAAEPLTASVTGDPNLIRKAISAGKLVWNIRSYGHLIADIDPLDIGKKAETRMLEPETYGLSKADLAALPAEWVWRDAPYPLENGWEAIRKLREAYSGTIAYEFSHVHDEQEREWLNRQAEAEIPSASLGPEERRALLARIVAAEQFEEFLQRTFVGQKRFSVEGVDVLVAMAEEIVHELTNDGARHILMGMAHRGRLNVLAHVLGKPYGNIFSEFHHSPNKTLIPSEGSIGINYGWTGDVKYHLGANRFIPSGETAETRLTLANNPSHLEFVAPVVAGFARAAQEDRSRKGAPVRNVDAAAAIVLHGDAAFPGEGIVAETLNLSDLRGYSTGGTIHVIVNNRIGFTTGTFDARSTHYASDPAKGFEIPIVHVNADDPEGCIAAARLAAAYRTRFHKDFLIDLVGYRRYGHNETDDPETTQPLIYRKVNAHPTVASLYADKLVREGAVTADDVERMKQDEISRLREAYEQVKRQEHRDPVHQTQPVAGFKPEPEIETAVDPGMLRRLNEGLLKRPEGFRMYPKLQRILERRANALDEGEFVDWGHAETLAFAAILADGRPIRLSGQDAERATFAHRNLVLHDYATGESFCPLHLLPEAKASFAIHNSPLSEAGVLGFEYGYNVYAPDTMVIWEAQYGDFANAAQVLIDQFISAGYSKWAQRSSLTLLLPHGYEGQGPEHSSARLERFLQLSAEGNWTVAYLSSAAQYFHLLRCQAAICGTEAARPLVLMAPKSLIRNPRVASPASELTGGTFRKVLEQPGLGERPDRVERLVLCTGKIAIDLAEALEKTAADPEDTKDWLHILRIEQLYPFPAEEIASRLTRFPNVKEICWVQEEPQNMGSWGYMESRIRTLTPAAAAVRYIGRPERASPASGFQQVHSFEQQLIVSQALTPPKSRAAQTTGGNGDV
ncbi:2-oxoglutarate dehydrogenase E1 component [Cohnella sp. CFH 77786]|uniref:2-oxoglutarate dehydrogenase E1 component n=1 Tax=Cohnella sp. CFH 77786 TaxID=2662265 RepID=UPI001C6105C2|nr:2-oxoglutarate dehydrogenase E1 component [Cohnella sp. CFH 77786]MBW5447997.1 2-oxoglutarate dehydrogenase E1 component [Cohnella sp. CFH 77786]